MRSTIFALLLCASPAAFCQSLPPAPVQPAPAFPTPPAFTQPPSLGGFNKPPTVFSFGATIPRGAVVSPLQQLQSQIDPQMIVHPPASSLGEESKGTLVAQNLYPGLEFLPIDQSKGKLQPIPITWPGFKMEPIPTDVSKTEMNLVAKGETARAAKK